MSLRLHSTGHVYWVYAGRARLVATPDALNDHFVGQEMSEIGDDELSSLLPGPQIPARVANPTSSAEMRVALVQDLRGNGLEIGPGAIPLQLSPFASIQYVDRFSDEEYAARSSGARNAADSYMPIDVVDDVLTLNSIEDSSMSFVLASHVIEHMADPLRLFDVAARKLRPGGKLVMIVPDKLRTFDNVRPVTPVDRLVLRYFTGERSRDIDGHFEVARYLDGLSWSEAFARAQQSLSDERDTHFHCYTHENFAALCEVASDLFGYSEVWSSRGIFLTDPTCCEFYFVLTRRNAKLEPGNDSQARPE